MSKQSRARLVQHVAAPDGPNTFLARWGVLLASGIVVLSALAAYHNSFSVPFIFDDQGTITDNPTIRHFGSALSPPNSSTAGGRPLLNLTLALNYALNGTHVWGYHALNLFIHVLAGLTLFGIVRRTLVQPVLSRRFGADAVPLALAVAALWVLHPLQTESVTYVVQRAESLMGLFYLLTLYFFIRSTQSQSPGGWQVLAGAACLLGMASKEVMVSAPLIVLLYDRTFVAGTFREAWGKRGRFYAGLAGTWLLLGGLVAGTQGRGGSAGFGTHVTWWSYALTQFGAIVHYLRLSLWPNPLVFDYGTTLATGAADIVPYAMTVLLLVIGTAFALWRRPVIGFVGCWFFAILAPTSSVVPVATQTMAEHRMYLALAPVAVLVVLGLYSLVGRRSAVIFLALAVGLGWLSVQRNKDYRSELSIWSDTVAKRPDNARALSNMGILLAKIPNRIPEAIAAFEAALQINPDSAETHYNLGNTLRKLPGRVPDAIAEYEAAVRINPGSAEAHDNFGNALLDVPGRVPDAVAQLEAALRINPDSAETHYNLGNALRKMPGRLPDAIAQFEAALRLDPDSVEAHNNFGTALLEVPGRVPDAIAQFEAALRLDPDSVEAHINLGNVLFNVPGRLPDAIVQFETALRLDPDSVEAHYDLGVVLAGTPGRVPDAIVQLKAALRLKPDLAPAQEILGRLQNQIGLQGTSPMDSAVRPE